MVDAPASNPSPPGPQSGMPASPPLPSQALGLESFPELLEWLVGGHYRDWAIQTFRPTSSLEPGERPSCALMARVLLSVGDLPGSRRRAPIESTYADSLQQLRTRVARRLPEECLERAVLALKLDHEWRTYLERKAAEWNSGKTARTYRREAVERAIRLTLSPAQPRVDDASHRIGPFQVRSRIGRGAQAVVWRGYDPLLDREVAIKELAVPAECSEEERAKLAARFLREARAAARLNHPGVVTIYSVAELEGKPAIIMELIEGKTLEAILTEGRLTTAQTCALLDQLLDAVGYAHQHGLVHRDIRPDNVFVTHDGLVKLTDFGIAQLVPSGTLSVRSPHFAEAAATVFTQTAMLGSPAYMAPERIRGDAVDARCDIFALGVIAYECLAGVNPFGARSSTHFVTIIHRIMSEPIPPLDLADPLAKPLDMVIAQALARNPEGRFDNASSMRIAWRMAFRPTLDPDRELLPLVRGSREATATG